MTLLAAIALVLAAVPAGLFVVNLFYFRAPTARSALRDQSPIPATLTHLLPLPASGRGPGGEVRRCPGGKRDLSPPAPLPEAGRGENGPGALPGDPSPTISVVIPARNEVANIGDAARAVLADGPLELIVVDDQSADDTPTIVRKLAAGDPRARLISAPPLPAGWCGKQHACQVGADHARGDLILFLDADVRLRPGALAALRDRLGADDLLSAFPEQLTGTWPERLLIPLMHFVLLGFLPLFRMRRSRHPAYAAGCGQVMLVRRTAYRAVGGHAAIRSSRMDGITLPRAFRLAGRATDICDGTDLAACRMYHGAGEVWAGLAKNAGEGLGAPNRIVPTSVLLAGGQVLPFLLIGLATDPLARGLAAAAAGLALLPRLVAVVRFRHSLLGAALHPAGVTLLLAVQWYALGRRLLGRPAGWRGRQYAPA